MLFAVLLFEIKVNNFLWCQDINLNVIGRVIDSLRLATWTENGQKAEVFSIMMRKLSLCGLMKKINLESFPCNKVLISTRSSIDFQEPAPTSRRSPSSHTILTLVTSHHAQPTSELPWELQFTSDYQSFHKTRNNSKPSLISTTYKSEVFTESTLNHQSQSSTSQTREDSVDQRRTSFKTCTMVSRPWSMLKRHFENTLSTAVVDEGQNKHNI